MSDCDGLSTVGQETLKSVCFYLKGKECECVRETGKTNLDTSSFYLLCSNSYN